MTVTILRLRELLADIATVPITNDCAIRGLQLDSRAVSRDHLFVALPGLRVDGRNYIKDAIAHGAAAVVYEAGGYEVDKLTVPAFGVHHLRTHLGTLANRCYGQPSYKLVVIGVTGTNGKTTCTQLLAQALDRLPRRCAVIGTLGYGFPGALEIGRHTTPDCVTSHRLLAEFIDADAYYTAMEVSSHALDQGRVDGVAFDIAVFTNLSRDHLDYHGDMDSYGRSKMRLFDWEGLEAAVVNCDDEFGRRIVSHVGGRYPVWTYGLREGDVRVQKLKTTRDGLWLCVATPVGMAELHTPLFGEFNALNLLAVLAVLLKLGVELDDAVERLTALQPIPGRVERFGGSKNAPLVVVDYAHSPDALEQVLRALRAHTDGDLWCVFGCGGDRDRGKRSQMGAIAERLADVVVLTDDNPRHESGDAIIQDIVGGMHTSPRIVRDRRQAIALAIHAAGPDDVVLVAGKGHEDYQQVGDRRAPYSDRETVRALLEIAA